MGRELSPEQNKFNDYIQKFDNYSRFDRSDFKNNEKVKELFTLYVEAIREREIEIHPSVRRIVYEVKIIEDELKKYFSDRILSDKTYKDKLVKGKYIQKIFALDNLSISFNISHPMYLGAEYNNNPINDYKVVKELKECEEQELSADEEILSTEKFQLHLETAREQVRITNSIEKWHKYCIAVNEAKAFIYKRYPRWGKFDSEEKTDARQDLKILIKQLQEFSNLSVVVLILENVIETKSYLNIFTTLKAEKLLSYNLPNINTIEIARKITKSLIEPYN